MDEKPRCLELIGGPGCGLIVDVPSECDINHVIRIPGMWLSSSFVEGFECGPHDVYDYLVVDESRTRFVGKTKGPTTRHG